ncbi:MFS transporter [Halobellus sp. Atlit-38R]|uniref:MFS transporter n=1 Tax=Halobellus sp. Atlit-38R TaxID=2282131 RepID=UPI000EF2391D|nr:MFS transporter [Halobellus sp. Atlit-38R]RLM94780.1 MFS transporter [Halobellus sp. Atlit-38R]
MTDAQDRRVVALVTGSHFVNHSYLVMLAPLVGVLAARFDVSIAAIGLAIGVQNAVVLVLQLPMGYVSDAYSRTLVLGISLVVGTLGAALTALATSYAWLLVAQLVLGVGVAGHHPAHYPLLAAVSTDENRGRAYSAHAFGGSVGLAAPYAVVAGTTALDLSWRVAIGVVAVVGAVFAAYCLLRFRSVDDEITRPGLAERPDERPTLRSVPGRIRALFRTLASSGGILGLTVLAFLTSAAAWAIRTYTPSLLVRGYGLPDGTASALTSAMLVVGAGLILAGGGLTDRVGAGPIVVGGYAALVVVAALLATLSLPLAAVGIVLLLSGSISFSRPARSTLADRLSRRADLGKNFALVTIGISLGGVVAPPVFGYLVDTAGLTVSFGLVSALGVLSLALGLRIVRDASFAVPGAAAGADGD